MKRNRLSTLICVLGVLACTGRAAEEGFATVQFDALFVEFPTQMIEQIARTNERPVPESEEILELWHKGKGTLLHALKLPTQSGINAQTEAVREITYPTEFVRLLAQSTNTAESLAAQLPFPGPFETRQVGAILNATPTVGADGRTMDVMLSAELADGPEWTQISVTATDENGQGLEISVPQPVFRSRNLTTSITMLDQSTHVLGGMTSPGDDGITYLFLTATLVDAAGRPMADAAGETPE